MVDPGLAVGIAGLFLALYFGVRSLFQQSDLEALQRTLRAYHQAMYNNLWRMGQNSEALLNAEDLNEARQLARGIGDMSQAARHWVVAFSKEQVRFTPSYEPAWEPKEPAPLERKPLWRRLFFMP
jgi:hypothetical protein